jgi:hypothetical protein
VLLLLLLLLLQFENNDDFLIVDALKGRRDKMKMLVIIG